MSQATRTPAALRALAPGLGLCAAVTLGAFLAERGERAVFGSAGIEALVLAILVGAAVRMVWTPGARWQPGIAFSARTLLECAVVLLGASISAGMIAAAGAGLLVGIALIVATAIAASYAIGRMLRLPPRMALLVACGNSICGNSAIAAVAPVIAADCDDVAAAISFTAVLGVIVVLGLPLVGAALGLGTLQYGAFAGLTVYAVPQVLAAAAPMGPQAVQMGALVKLVRVLMLGPVCLVLGLLAPRLGRPGAHAVAERRVRLGELVPWFIVGFLGLMAMRSAGALPHAALAPMAQAAMLLTVLSMAALGLGVDMRALRRAGGPVTLAVVLSLLVLGAISLALIHCLKLG